MNKRYSLILILLSGLLIAGCSDDDQDDDDTRVVIVDDNNADQDLHTLYGSLEVQDERGFALPDALIEIEVTGNGQVQDAFSVVTGSEGVVTFEISQSENFRPYRRMSFSISRPGYQTLRDSIPIDITSEIPDGNGSTVFLYEAGAVVILALR